MQGAEGTVLVWVAEALDVSLAQDVARTVCRNSGLDGEAAFLAAADVCEKGTGLLSSGDGGLLVLVRRGPRLDVRSVGFGAACACPS